MTASEPWTTPRPTRTPPAPYVPFSKNTGIKGYVPLYHIIGQAYHKMSKLLVNWERGCVHGEGKRTSLWTSAKLRPALFRANTLHNRLFSEPPTVNRGKHVVSRHFYRGYLKANKITKSEGITKVEYAHYFRTCPDAVHQKLSKLFHGCQLVETTACQSWRIFETQCITVTIYSSLQVQSER